MKKIVLATILIASILVINNLIHSIASLWQKQQLVLKAEQELQKQKKENRQLQKDLAYSQTEQFVEQEARNKLLLVKPQEHEVLIQKDLLGATSSAVLRAEADTRPNWQKWWELFFSE